MIGMHTFWKPAAALMLAAGLFGTAGTASAGTPIYSQDFEVDAGGYGMTGLWHRTSSACAAGASGFYLYYGVEGPCNFASGTNFGDATSPVIDLSLATAPVTLTFRYSLGTEQCLCCLYDRARVDVSDGGPYTTLASNDVTDCPSPTFLSDPSGGWVTATVDLSAYAGEMITLRFGFDTVDSLFNTFLGFAVDDIEVVADLSPQGLTLEVPGPCVSDTQIEVELWARNLEGPVSGYQTFIEYDVTKLAYNGALSSYTASPFTLHIESELTAEVAPGEIRLDGNTGFFNPPYSPPPTDVLLATLVFDVVDDCTTTAVDFDLGQPFESELSLEGVPLPTGLTNTGNFTLDDTPPDIICPGNIKVFADAGGCDAVLDPPIEPPLLIGGEAAARNVGGVKGYIIDLKSDIGLGQFSFVSYTIDTPFTFSALSSLSTDYNMQAGCFGCGSPRFSVRVDFDNDGVVSPGDKNVFVYFGTPAGFVDCPPLGTWIPTGNFVTDPTTRWDSTQVGGTFYGTYASANALVGTKLVLRVSVVTDGGSGGCTGGHEMWVNNFEVNGLTFTFDNGFIVSDNCSTPVVTATRSDSMDLDDPYPSGTTTITYTATDACNNVSSCMQQVQVNPYNEVDVVVDLVGSLPTSRCIRFVTDDCDVFVDETMVFTDHDSNVLTPVRATATILVDCGSYTFLCAKDEQHSMWDTSLLSIVGPGYIAATTLVLEPGDTDNDGDVDINDVTWLLFTFGDFDAPGGCPWDGTRDADFDNGGAVGSEDYSLLSSNWLEFTDCACVSFIVAQAPNKRVLSLPTTGMSAQMASRVDLDRDGTFDHKDVRLFELRHGLPDTLSTKMKP